MLIPIGFFRGGAAAGAYELISTTVLGSAQTSVTFDVSTYGSTYKHLQIRFAARNTGAFGDISHRIKLNASTSGYADHALEGNGSSVSSQANSSQSFGRIGRLPAANQSANIFGSGVIDLLDFASTSKNKTLRSFAGSAGYNYVSLYSSLWALTSAVTSIELFGEVSQYIAGSRFSIYGLKG